LLLAAGFYVYQPSADQITRLTEDADKVRQERQAKIAANFAKLKRDLDEWDANQMVVAQLPTAKFPTC
jgi:hypothetical protein